jgi:RimJ/RimL family protein N-acetyltransferase
VNDDLDKLVPDVPRWVEARGMVVSKRCEVLGDEASGYVLSSKDGPLICVVGRPRASVIREATERLAPTEIIAPPDSAALVAEGLPEWLQTPYAVQLLGSSPLGRVSNPPADVRICETEEQLPLDHVSETLRTSITNALRWSPVAAVFIEGKAVAFCYASWQTERFWDVSIETLDAYRRRGLATECVRTLVRRMHKNGKQPVWGAPHTNIAAIRVAKKLGFRPVDQMVQFAMHPG